MQDGTYDVSFGGMPIGKAKVTASLPDPMQASFLTDQDIQIMATVLTGEIERWRYRIARSHGHLPECAAIFACLTFKSEGYLDSVN